MKIQQFQSHPIPSRFNHMSKTTENDASSLPKTLVVLSIKKKTWLGRF